MIVLQRKKAGQLGKDPIRYPWTFLVPALAIYLLFFFYPTVSGFYYALTNWNSRTINIKFVGISQFYEVLKNPTIVLAFRNTLIYAFTITIVKNVIGLVLALALNAKIRSRSVLRAVFFAPAILNVVAMGLVFKGLMNPTTGFFNTALDALGLHFLTNNWYTDPKIAIHCTSIMEIWRATGISMAIYLAGLQSIPNDYYEAATLDGAYGWKKFRHVTLPLLAPSVTINVILCLIYGFRMFEVIQYLTEGGPGDASQVMQTLAYKYMGQGLFGYSAAINVTLVVFILIFTIPLLIYMRRRDSQLM